MLLPAFGNPAPDFTLADHHGRALGPAELRGEAGP